LTSSDFLSRVSVLTRDIDIDKSSRFFKTTQTVRSGLQI